MLTTEPNSGCEFVQSWQLLAAVAGKPKGPLSTAEFGHWKANLPIVGWRRGATTALLSYESKNL